MTRIAGATNAAVSLGVVDQTDILVVQLVQGSGALQLNTSIGTRLPIATTAAGWVYLCSLDRASRNSLLKTLKSQYRGKWPDLRAAIEQAAELHASKGFVVSKGWFHPDVSGVAAVICDRNKRPAYVVTCGGPTMRGDDLLEEIGPRISLLARNLTATLASRT
jgi:DNA-binding IclR family transcriptional regulator